MRFWLFLILGLGTGGCGEDTDSKADTGQEPEELDTQDTGGEPDPVWEETTIETSNTLNGVYASGRGVYAVGTEGSLYKYTVSTDWVQQEIDVDEEDLNGLWGAGQGDTLHLVAVGNGGTLLQLDGTAVTTDDLGTNNFESVHGPEASNLIAVGWGGVYRLALGAWEYEPLPTNDRLNHVWATTSIAYGVGEDGAILQRSGDTWTEMESPSSKNLYGVYGTADNDVWAVGQEGTVLHFDGSAWTQIGSPTEQTLWAVWASSSVAVYAVGSNGVAIRWDGAAWNELPTGLSNNLYAVHGTDDDDCWAVGNRGVGLHYTGG